MLISIANILDAGGVEDTRALAQQTAWIDGSATAGRTAKQVKHNLQADLSSRSGAKLRKQLEDAILSHPVLKAAALPNRLVRLMISKTEAGGGYGMHVDNPYMATRDGPVRTDLSFTLFLSDPTAYDGGELMIEQAGQTQTIKPPAGDLVLYPSPSLHQVNQVTAGVRYVCVGWIESQVKQADDRAMLFDLQNLKASLAQHYDPQSIEMLTLSQVIANLIRRLS